MTYHFGKSFLPTYCVMRKKGERAHVFSDGRKGRGKFLIQTESVYRIFLLLGIHTLMSNERLCISEGQILKGANFAS